MAFYLLFAILICKTTAMAHPFYKNLSPDMEWMYNTIKQMETDAIEEFKKAYPRVPAYAWENVNALQEVTLSYLHKDNFNNSDHTNSIEPVFPQNPTNEKILDYCKQCINHQLAQQNLDSEKIAIVVDNKPSSYFYASSRSIQERINDYGELIYDVNTNRESIFVGINSEKILKQVPFQLKQASVHEVSHIIEAHDTKRKLIHTLISKYYEKETFNTEQFLSCFKQLKQSQELMADLLPAILSSDFAIEFHLHEEKIKESRGDGYATSFELVFWLNKIIWLHKRAQCMFETIIGINDLFS